MILSALTYPDLKKPLTDRFVTLMDALSVGSIDTINEAADSLNEVVEVIKERSREQYQ